MQDMNGMTIKQLYAQLGECWTPERGYRALFKALFAPNIVRKFQQDAFTTSKNNNIIKRNVK